MITQTPNPYLDPQNIPSVIPRHITPPGPKVSYPLDSRCTLQWLDPENPFVEIMMPNNSDVTFRTCIGKHKLTELLLHYNYGAAAAVKWWGHNMRSFAKQSTLLVPGSPFQHSQGHCPP